MPEFYPNEGTPPPPPTLMERPHVKMWHPLLICRFLCFSCRSTKMQSIVGNRGFIGTNVRVKPGFFALYVAHGKTIWKTVTG